MNLVNINFIFTPLYNIGYNIIPRRILEYSEYYNSWNYLSSISSKITIIKFIIISRIFIFNDKMKFIFIFINYNYFHVYIISFYNIYFELEYFILLVYYWKVKVLFYN